MSATRPKNPMRYQTSVFLTVQQEEALRAMAEAKDRTVSYLVRLAVARLIATEEKTQ